MASPDNHDEKHQPNSSTPGAAYSNNRYYSKSSSAKEGCQSSGSKKLFNPLMMDSPTDKPKEVNKIENPIHFDYNASNSGETLPANLLNKMQLNDKNFSSTNYAEIRDHRNPLDYGNNSIKNVEGDNRYGQRFQSTRRYADSTQQYDLPNRYNRQNDISPTPSKDYRNSDAHTADPFEQFRKRKSAEFQQNNNWRYPNDNSGATMKTELNGNEYTPSPNNSLKKSVVVRRANVDYEYDINRMESISRKMILDSHCHLDRIFDQWNKDKLGLTPDKWRGNNNPPDCRPLEYLKSLEQFKDAFGNKFEGCISVCCDPPTWTKSWYDWLAQEDDIWLTYGCHPAKAALFVESAENTLQMLLSFPKVVALGEIGLDDTYYERAGATKEVQVDAFKRQVQIAMRMKKSLVIHLRGEVQDLARQLLCDSGLPQDWKIHMHCFNQPLHVAQEWLNDWPNMKFGVVPNFYDRDVGKHLPLKHLLLETDSPYFVPKKLKDSENAPKLAIPGHVFHTAAQIAALRDLPIEDIFEANRKNIEEVYGIPFEDGKDSLEEKIPHTYEDPDKTSEENTSKETQKNTTSSVTKNEHNQNTIDRSTTSNQNENDVNNEQEENVSLLPLKPEKRPREESDGKYDTYFKEAKKPKIDFISKLGTTHSEEISQQTIWLEIKEKVKEQISNLIIKTLFEDSYDSKRPQSGYRDSRTNIQSPLTAKQEIKQEPFQRMESIAKGGNNYFQSKPIMHSMDENFLGRTANRIESKSCKEAEQDFKVPKVPTTYTPGKFMIPRRSQNTNESFGESPDLNRSHKHGDKEQHVEKERSKKFKEKEKNDDLKRERKEFDLWLEKKKSKAKKAGEGEIKYSANDVMDLFYKWKKKKDKEYSFKTQNPSTDSRSRDKHQTEKADKRHHDETKHKSKKHEQSIHTGFSKYEDKSKKQKDTPREKNKLK